MTSRDLLSMDARLFHRRQDPADFYDRLHAFGIKHGPAFQQIQEIRRYEGNSLGRMSVADTRVLMREEYESEHVIHPITLDNILQAMYTAVPVSKSNAGARVPRSFKSISIKSQNQVKAGGHVHVGSQLLHDRHGGFSASSVVSAAGDEQPLAEIDGLFCQSIGPAANASSPEASKDNLRMHTTFDRSLVLADDSMLRRMSTLPSDDEESVGHQDLRQAAQSYIANAVSQLTQADIEQFLPHQVR